MSTPFYHLLPPLFDDSAFTCESLASGLLPSFHFEFSFLRLGARSLARSSPNLLRSAASSVSSFALFAFILDGIGQRSLISEVKADSTSPFPPYRMSCRSIFKDDMSYISGNSCTTAADAQDKILEGFGSCNCPMFSLGSDAWVWSWTSAALWSWGVEIL